MIIRTKKLCYAVIFIIIYIISNITCALEKTNLLPLNRVDQLPIITPGKIEGLKKAISNYSEFSNNNQKQILISTAKTFELDTFLAAHKNDILTPQLIKDLQNFFQIKQTNQLSSNIRKVISGSNNLNNDFKNHDTILIRNHDTQIDIKTNNNCFYITSEEKDKINFYRWHGSLMLDEKKYTPNYVVTTK